MALRHVVFVVLMGPGDGLFNRRFYLNQLLIRVSDPDLTGSLVEEPAIDAPEWVGHSGCSRSA